ncbi:MAG: N-acyl homoserine lactonase family protein [Rhodoglobus sp.]|nr:N-acyl homoserine lactonase family protein [Rhodoglobus sp.]
MTGSADDTYEIVIVKFGTRQTVRSEVYLNYQLYHEDDGPIGMDYFMWIIRNESRTILVDTGFSAAGGDARKRTTLVPPMEAYAALGILPESAPPIVITHAHYDHTGHLSQFPASEIVIARAELDFWSGPQAHQKQFHHSVEDDDLAVLWAAETAGRVTSFTGSHRLAPGVEVIQVGGHTPGQSIVRVQTRAGSVLLASDAVHYYEELEREMPFMSVADLVAMYDSFDTIQGMLADGTVTTVVSGHDPDTLRRFTPLDGPLDGPLAGLAAVVGGAS